MKLRKRELTTEESAAQFRDKVEETMEGSHYEDPSSFTEDDLIPTGSTLLNLACSDTPFGGFAKGKMSNVVGDSSAGKSFLVLTMLAIIAQIQAFANYDLYYDDGEHALSFNIDYLFGQAFNERVKYDFASRTVQNLLANLMSILKKGRPFIYVLDSFDSVTSNEAIARALKGHTKKATLGKGIATKEADAPPPKDDGSYKTEKARAASDLLAILDDWLPRTGSHLCVVFQTRDAINSMFQTKTKSGGKSWKFYATHEMWLSNLKTYTKTFSKIKRDIGGDTGLKVSKNKLTGKSRVINFPIFYDYGIDDINSCINFCVDSGQWKTKNDGKIIVAEDLDLEADQPTLVKAIEANGMERLLQEVTGVAWNRIEEGVRLGRKRKFG